VGKTPATAVDFLEALVVRSGGVAGVTPRLGLSFELHDVGEREIAYSVVIGWWI
jgi:hypothetical protein